MRNNRTNPLSPQLQRVTFKLNKFCLRVLCPNNFVSLCVELANFILRQITADI